MANQPSNGRSETELKPAKVAPAGSAFSRLFGAIPRGWAIVLLAGAAWVALALIVFGVMGLFAG